MGSLTGVVSSATGHDNGRWSVAGPRLPGTDRVVARIRKPARDVALSVKLAGWPGDDEAAR